MKASSKHFYHRNNLCYGIASPILAVKAFQVPDWPGSVQLHLRPMQVEVAAWHALQQNLSNNWPSSDKAWPVLWDLVVSHMEVVVVAHLEVVIMANLEVVVVVAHLEVVVAH